MSKEQLIEVIDMFLELEEKQCRYGGREWMMSGKLQQLQEALKKYEQSLLTSDKKVLYL